MLIAQKLFSPFHSLVWLYERTSTFLYTKSKSKEGKSKGYLEINPKSVSRFPWLMGGCFFLIICLLVQIVYAIKYQHENNAAILVATFLFYASLTTHFPTVVVHYYRRNQFCAGFNAFLDFERRYNSDNWLPDEAKRGLGRRKIMYIRVLFTTCSLIALSHWKNQIDAPCFPGNFGYFLLDECNGTLNLGSADKYVKIGLSTFSAGLYMFTTTTTFIEYETAMLFAYCLTNYLRLLMRNLDIQLDKKSMSSKEMDKLFLMYKEIELLTKDYNMFRAGTCVTFNVMDCCIAFIIACYAVIGLRDDLPTAAFVNCVVLVFDGYCAIKEFNQYKSGVFQVSDELVSKYGTLPQISARKIYRRRLKSWRILRCYLGSDNFFDELTPLTLIDFSVGQTVSLLLL